MEDYKFFNGAEYNNFIREKSAVSMAAFGDGCMNLSYQTRNNAMLARIDSAIAENVGKRIIVLTGAQHKHYFDDALRRRHDVKVVDFQQILPLKETTISTTMQDFYNKNLARGYYDENDAAFADLMYHGTITPILHGMDMDYNPKIIPAQNIAQAAPIMAEWQAAAPNSALLQFNLAWIAFLEKDYERAISLLVPIAERLDETPPSMHDFVKPFYWRNLYFCYDMAHKHDRAAAAFNQCRIVCNSLGFNNDYAKTICRR